MPEVSAKGHQATFASRNPEIGYTCCSSDWLWWVSRDPIFREKSAAFCYRLTSGLPKRQSCRRAGAVVMRRGTNVRQSKRAVFDHRSTDRCGRSAWLQSLSGSKATRGPPNKCWSEWREDPRKVESGHRCARLRRRLCAKLRRGHVANFGQKLPNAASQFNPIDRDRMASNAGSADASAKSLILLSG